jgi:hypothetical protein
MRITEKLSSLAVATGAVYKILILVCLIYELAKFRASKLKPKTPIKKEERA